MEEITPTLVSKPDVVLRDGVWSKERWIVVVQSLIHVQLFVTRWTAAFQASLSFTISLTLLKLMSIESIISSNHLVFCCTFSSCLNLSSIKVFYKDLVLHTRWPKLLELQHQYFQWIFRVISFRINWLDLLAFQGTLKSLQDHNWQVSSLWLSAFFMIQLSHPYMTTGKTIA